MSAAHQALAAAGLAAALAGCQTPPPQAAPATSTLPASWATGLATDDEAAVRGEWSAVAADPRLRALLAAADADNPELGAARARLAAAEQRAAQEASGRFGQAQAPALSLTDAWSGGSRQRSRMATAGWQLEADLGGVLAARAAAATALAEAARADLQDQRAALRAEMVSQYWQLAWLHERLSWLAELAGIAERLAGVAQARERAGAARPSEAAAARSAAAWRHSELAAGQAALKRVEGALARLQGRNARPWAGPPPRLPAWPLDPVPVGLPAAALAGHAGLQAERWALAGRQQEARAARGQQWPALSLNAALSAAGGPTAALAGLGLVLPWLDAPARQRQVDMADRAVAEGRATAEAAQLQALQAARDALLERSALASREQAAAAAAAATRQALDTTHARATAGAASLHERLMAEAAWLDSQMAWLDQRWARLANDVALRRLTGHLQLPPPNNDSGGTLPTDE